PFPGSRRLPSVCRGPRTGVPDRVGQAAGSMTSKGQSLIHPMNAPDATQLLADYERDGVVVVRQFLDAWEVAAVRAELERYIRDDLASKPADSRTFEADNRTVRNLWRLEQH